MGVFIYTIDISNYLCTNYRKESYITGLLVGLLELKLSKWMGKLFNRISSSYNATIKIWSGNKNSSDIADCGNWEEGKMPSPLTNVLIPGYATPFPIINSNLTVKKVTVETGAYLTVNPGIILTVNEQ